MIIFRTEQKRRRERESERFFHGRRSHRGLFPSVIRFSARCACIDVDLLGPVVFSSSARAVDNDVRLGLRLICYLIDVQPAGCLSRQPAVHGGKMIVNQNSLSKEFVALSRPMRGDERGDRFPFFVRHSCCCCSNDDYWLANERRERER